MNVFVKAWAKVLGWLDYKDDVEYYLGQGYSRDEAEQKAEWKNG